MNRIAVGVAFVSGLILLPSLAEAQQVTMIREKDKAADALFIFLPLTTPISLTAVKCP